MPLRNPDPEGPPATQAPAERSPPVVRRRFFHRHPLIVRLTHWTNALCFSVLLASGLQIFNAYPKLHWGRYGADADRAVLSIGADETASGLRGYLAIGPIKLPTTGVLGVSSVAGEPTARAFPTWLTLPSNQDLATGRRWHFFFAWLLVINGSAYLAYALSGHLRRTLLPQPDQLSLQHLWHEVRNHARLRFPKGREALRYNALQKITYLLVVLLALPLMVWTGMAMSPALDALLPCLTECLGGRAAARTLHFVTASALVIFVVVHVTMVIASGTWNNLRSMLSGRYAIELEEDTP